ncbi:MAG: DUF2254 family protein, partial [Rhodospirillales bacterium]
MDAFGELAPPPAIREQSLLDGLQPLPSRWLQDEPDDVLPEDFEQRSARFGPEVPGYIQAIEFDQLIETACTCEIMIGLYFRPGDYVAEDGRGIAIYPGEHDSPALREKILKAIIVGVHRTPVQDSEFSIRHLVEIGVRALSPGVARTHREKIMALDLTRRMLLGCAG